MEEWLEGDGWIPNFKKAYGIKEYHRHGEAASADLVAVEAERTCLQKVLAQYAPRDRFNFDETGLFAFAPPDHGLSTQQMSGKKGDKFRITLGVACNADGSEKLPLLFIGKYKNPRCFKQTSPQSHGLYYHHNKNAWMTKEIFEEYG
ncbi:hypothetical protein PISMIDRAFT_120578 [Pisolithus microcarpus 441]|uniref:Unplaced genomic scaffold scaffold_381, whole genome shotgun sequence n=1 Tax=Pisolithus microcarpus 441 TaxID=765257 RepID=A0A0C9YFB1_9AGAM|nr:hypothetical protein PISMIDRAFT_120578 [Pisolithus microcarpus 441]